MPAFQINASSVPAQHSRALAKQQRVNELTLSSKESSTSSAATLSPSASRRDARPERAKAPFQVDGTESDSMVQGFNAVLSRQHDLKKVIQDLQAGQDRIREEVRKVYHSLHEFGGAVSGSRAMSQSFSHGHLGTNSLAHDGDTDVVEDPSWHRRSVGSSVDLSRTPSGAVEQASDRDWYPSEAFMSYPCQKEYCGVHIRPAFRKLSAEAHDVMRFAATLGKTRVDFDMPTGSPTLGASPAGPLCHPVICGWARPIHPESTVRLWLDMATMLVLVFDSVSVPYQVSFNPDVTTGFWLIVNLVTLLVWTLDFGLGFFTGYYDQGGVVMDIRKIARRYLGSFFFIDLLTVGTDWVSMTFNLLIISGSALVQGNGNTTTFLKLFRVLKLNRMIRLMGALQSGKFGQMHDRIISWSWQLGVDRQLQFAMNVMYLTFAILWLNHIGCCFWNAMYDQGITNWEQQQHPPGSKITRENHDPEVWQYFLGFYWSMTAMASGASIMHPTSLTELVFTIGYVLFGLLVGSSLISSLAAMLLDLQMSSKERRDSVRRLRQYLYQQGLDTGLSLAVEKEVVSRISQEKRLGANEVECLTFLSATMRSSLNYAIYCKPLKQHSFLGACDVLDRAGMFTRDLCEYGIEHNTVRPGSSAFAHGEQCDGPYYIVLGELEYLSRARESDVAVPSKGTPRSESKEQPVMVESGQWLCELAIWLDWKCRGTLEACVPCEFFQVKADVLLQSLAQSEDLAFMARAYGEALCNAVETEESQPQTDMPLREELHQSVVLSMPPQGRRGMSAAAMKLLESEKDKGLGRLPFGRSPPNTKLIEQVEQGKCDLVIFKGQVLRVVSVVVVRLEREVVTPDGKIVRQLLAQLGKSKAAEDAKCQLPGGKVRAGELPGDALARILGGQLFGLQHAGLRQEELLKVDGVIELVERVESGANELRVSSLADLIVSSLIQIEQERGKQSEIRTVVGIDRFSGSIELDKPLKYNYSARSRITKSTGSKSSGEYGVETKYIRSIFCGKLDERGESLEASGEAVRPLVRSSRRPSVHSLIDIPTSPSGNHFAAIQDPTEGYEAFLLMPRKAEKSSGGGAKRANDDGIPCAWVDEHDFAMLSTTQAGGEMVKKWVSELVLPAAEEDDNTARESYTLPAFSTSSPLAGHSLEGVGDAAREYALPVMSDRPKESGPWSGRPPEGAGDEPESPVISA
jgi:hypothetical protein